MSATSPTGPTNSALFDLLPAVYRIRDAQIAQSQALLTAAEQALLTSLQALTPPLPADQQAQLDELTAKATRGPLESLLMLVQEQVDAVAYDLDQLYDDQFIETCASWVIPYIGDLIGYQAVEGIAPAIDNPRSEVAETISLRRRKGTVLVMEQLARDATGWGAHAVEFFRILADTQYMNHIRHGNHYAPDLRRWKPGLYMDTGFDRTAHTVDVRRIASGRGRYNIQNIGIFLWSLGAYSITAATATAAAPDAKDGTFCYRFSSLGMDIPLFHRAISQGEQIAAPAEPFNVPDRLLRRVLCDDLQKGVGTVYYGEGASLAIYLGGKLLNPYQILVADLSGPEGSWANLPLPAGSSPYLAAVDPELGRIALSPQAVSPASPPALTFSYNYGFNAEIGGGEYSRETSFVVTNPEWIVPFPDPRFTDFRDALTFALGQLALNGEVALEIASSVTYTLTAPLVIDLPAGATFELRAAAGARPTLLLDGELGISGDASSTFILNGLLIAADSSMTPGPSSTALVHLPKLRPSNTTNLLGQLSLTDCTLVPGWSVDPHGKPISPTAPALLVESAAVSATIERSILGSIRAAEFATISLCDSIMDATSPTNIAYAAPGSANGNIGGGALTLTGCTVVGKVHASLLSLVSNSIFWASLLPADTPAWASALVADRRQEGCVRFSFLPIHAVTPRQFECVHQKQASPQPYFSALRYGHPAYMKLLPSTGDSIRRGASDGGEMGAFHFLLAPQRESDLQIRMQEYLPVGLEFGLVYQN